MECSGSSLDNAALAAWNPDADLDPLSVAQEAAEKSGRIIENAKQALASYLLTTEPTREARQLLAGHAIRLAKLDPVYRAKHLGPTLFDEPAPDDEQDLLNLLEIVPFDSLLHDKVMLLNPCFGNASALIGGADGDFITGDMLVDFKTITGSEMSADYLDQLFGYYLLAHHQHAIDPAFPAIHRLAIYFCRHGHLWAWNTTTWTNHPLFDETEKWFISHAREVFPSGSAC